MSLQSCPTLCHHMDRSLPGFSVHGDSPGKNTGVGCHALHPGDLPNPGIEPRSPTLQVDSLQSEPPGKPKNTGVGSLSLLQGIFPTQESNWGLLHCRQILYQLSHKGSLGLSPGLGRSPGEGIGYPLQYSWASMVAQLEKNIHIYLNQQKLTQLCTSTTCMCASVVSSSL